METTDVEDLGVLDKSPDLGRLEVLNLVVVGGGKIGDHGSVVAGDDNTTASSGLGLVDAVLGANTLAIAGFAELIGLGVLADTANVDGGLSGKDVLGGYQYL